MILPPDVFWPIRVKVKTDGDCLPFEMRIWYRWQFEANKQGLAA